MKAFEKMEKTQKRKREYRKRPDDQSNTSQLEGNNAYHQMLKYDHKRYFWLSKMHNFSSDFQRLKI